MLRSEYNFVVDLRRQSHCSSEQASRLHGIYAKYINSSRATVLNSTCGSCVQEMFADVCEYIQREDLKIIED